MDGNYDERECFLSFPLFRVWTCGVFRVERLVAPSSSVYQPVRAADWGGSHYPRLLLKALLCCPGRRARREALIEMLWPGLDFEQASQYLNTGATKLRRVLCGTKGSESLFLTNDDSSSYRLDQQPFLWVDADAALTLFHEAECVGRTSRRALPLLEEAIDYLNNGPFLEDEGGEWANGRRGLLDETRYNGRLWLTEAYEQQGMVGQAEMQLRALLADDPTDEDVLCRLMTFLHRHGMTHKAWRLYQQISEQVAKEGQELTSETRALAEQLRTNRYYVQQTFLGHGRGVASPLSLSSITLEGQGIFVPSEGGVLVPAAMQAPMSPQENIAINSALWFIFKQHRWNELISHYSSQALLSSRLQEQLNMEFDEVPPRSHDEEYTISRRQAIGAIIALPLVLLTTVRAKHVRLAPEEFLPRCAASLTACWNLLNGDEISLVGQVLPAYLPTLMIWAQQPSKYQQMAAYLGAQGALLMALVEYHRFRFREYLAYCTQAVEFAEVSGDRNLSVFALVWLASALSYTGQAEAELQKLQEAAHSMREVLPPLQSYVSAQLARAHAKNGQKQDALRAIGEARSIFHEYNGVIPCFVSADYGLFSLILWEGMIHLALGESDPSHVREHSSHARIALTQFDALPPTIHVPSRFDIEIANYRAAAAVGERNMADFEKYLLVGAQGARVLGSEKRRQEVLDNWKAGKNAWSGEAKILKLADALI